MGSGGPVAGLISEKYNLPRRSTPYRDTDDLHLHRFGWRYAFLLQLPFFALSFILTSRFLTYSTPGKSKGVWAILKRVDYLGSGTLLVTVCIIAHLRLFLHRVALESEVEFAHELT